MNRERTSDFTGGEVGELGGMRRFESPGGVADPLLATVYQHVGSTGTG